MSRWQFVKEHSTIFTVAFEALKITFTIVAAGYVYFEYDSKQRDEKIKRAMEFQARWTQGEILSARTKLATTLHEQGEEATSTPEKIDAIVKSKGLQDQLTIVVFHLEQVTTCLEKDLCERETTCAVFSRSVRAVNNTYRGVFRRWEGVWGRDVMAHPSTVFRAQCEQIPAKRSCIFSLFSCGSSAKRNKGAVLVTGCPIDA